MPLSEPNLTILPLRGDVQIILAAIVVAAVLLVISQNNGHKPIGKRPRPLSLGKLLALCAICECYLPKRKQFAKPKLGEHNHKAVTITAKALALAAAR